MILAESATVTITVAVIGLIGVILGALLKIFSDELKTITLGRRKGSNEFLGHWKCAWSCDYGDKIRQSVEDRVEVTKAVGDRFFATGSNMSGTYVMTGTIKNNDIILLSYPGDNLKDALGGVVILIADKKRSSMRGRWDEYSNKEAFRGGPTFWEKDK